MAVIRAVAVLLAFAVVGGALVAQADAALGLLVATVGVAVALLVLVLAALARWGTDRRAISG